MNQMLFQAKEVTLVAKQKSKIKEELAMTYHMNKKAKNRVRNKTKTRSKVKFARQLSPESEQTYLYEKSISNHKKSFTKPRRSRQERKYFEEDWDEEEW